MKILLLSFLFLARFASAECVQLREATNASGKNLNIVFVASGFNGKLDLFEESIRTFWQVMEAFEPFSPRVNSLNVFVSKFENGADSFCKFDGRLLNCTFLRAQSLGDKCKTNGKRQIITIHNSTDYGGKGGISPAASVHKEAVNLIVHELGHSLFNLSDEYTREDAAHIGKNCVSKSNNCSRWQDLIDAGLATCSPGCKNNNLMTGDDSIMRSFATPTFGHVNQRLICCVFKKTTNEFPSFCDQYKNVGEGLERFCR